VFALYGCIIALETDFEKWLVFMDEITNRNDILPKPYMKKNTMIFLKAMGLLAKLIYKINI